MCTRATSVLTGEAVNARDLGGLPTGGTGSTACGALYRGGPLAYLTDAGCQAFKDLGIKTVVDLRIESERLGTPDAECLDASMVLAPLPIPYSVSPTDYLNDLHTHTSIAEVFRALGDASAYPVYFHCTYGRDRTGVLAAVLLRALGVSREDVMQDYLISKETVGAYPASLEAVLNEIDTTGIGAYLGAAGVTDAQVAMLRSRALVP